MLHIFLAVLKAALNWTMQVALEDGVEVGGQLKPKPKTMVFVLAMGRVKGIFVHTIWFQRDN